MCVCVCVERGLDFSVGRRDGVVMMMVMIGLWWLAVIMVMTIKGRVLLVGDEAFEVKPETTNNKNGIKH